MSDPIKDFLELIDADGFDGSDASLETLSDAMVFALQTMTQRLLGPLRSGLKHTDEMLDKSELKTMREASLIYSAMQSVKTELLAAMKHIDSATDKATLAIRGKLEAEGVERASMNGFTYKIVAKDSFRVDPEKWNEFVEWCAKEKHFGAIQRRVGTKALAELAASDEGLPEMVTMEKYSDLSITADRAARNEGRH